MSTADAVADTAADDADTRETIAYVALGVAAAIVVVLLLGTLIIKYVEYVQKKKMEMMKAQRSQYTAENKGGA